LLVIARRWIEPQGPAVYRNDLLRFRDRLALSLGALRFGCCPGGGALAFLRSAVRTHEASVPRTIGGRQGAADYFIPPPSIARSRRGIAESVRRIDRSLSVE
jgi:hypothetical protein